MRYAGISIAVLLLYTAPVYVTLLSPFFLKERITKRGMASLFISIAGILLVILPGNSTNVYDARLMIGIALGMVSGLSYSGTIMTISYLKDEYSGLAQLFWSTFISLLILLPFGIKVPGEVLMMNLGTLIVFGMVTAAFASVLYLNSASKIRAQTVSVLALLEPVSGIILGFIFLHEPVFMNTIQGCVFILLGSLVLVLEPGHMAGIMSMVKRPDLYAMGKQKPLRMPVMSYWWLRK